MFEECGGELLHRIGNNLNMNIRYQSSMANPTLENFSLAIFLHRLCWLHVFWIFPTFSGDIFLIFLFYEFWNPSIKGKTPIVLFYKTSDSPVSQFTPRPDFSFPSPTKKASWGVWIKREIFSLKGNYSVLVDLSYSKLFSFTYDKLHIFQVYNWYLLMTSLPQSR